MQDAPGDAAPAFLARLQTTEQLLVAMRKAGAARARIQSRGGPVAHEQQLLTGLKSVALQPGHRWLPVTCTQLELSACGGWLAACLQAEQASEHQPSVFCMEWYFYEVAIYRVLGLELQTRLACGTSAANLQWAPDASNLSIALRPFLRDQGPDFVPPEIPAACIVDAETGAVLSSLSERTCEAVLALTMHPGSERSSINGEAEELTWARSGRRFLFMQQTYVGSFEDGNGSAGLLRVFDVPGDQMVLETRYICEDQPWEPGVWHPSSGGIAFVSDIWMAEPGVFACAQLAVGCLPSSSHMLCADPGFSADGQLYCVKLVGHCSTGFQLLKCSLQEHRLVFSPLHQITGWYFQWASANSVAALQQSAASGTRCAKDTTCVWDMATLDLHGCLDAQPSFLKSQLPKLSFSPSQQLVAYGAEPQILCAKTGAQLWSSAASPEDMLDELGQPTGTGPLWPGWAVHWLPSGRGLIALATTSGHAAYLHHYLFS